jgi:K+-sensing histidine kinase KdpD
MPLKSAARFAQLSSALGGIIIEHTNAFAKEHELPPMQAAGLDQMSTKLDDFAAELLMFGTDTWPESAASDEAEVTHEAAPSDVDPPKSALPCSLCTFGAVAASLILGAIALFTFGTGDYFTIAFGVLAVALFFGPLQALTAASSAALLHNFFLVGTPFEFDRPTKVEMTMAVFFVALALITPWLARQAAKWRYRYGTTSPNRFLA